MKTLTTLLLAHLAIGCVAGDNDAPGIDAPEATPDALFPTCADIAKAHPDATDGEFKLYLDHDPNKWFLAYCADMDSQPKSYLTLHDDMTWSEYSAGGRAIGTSVRTQFDKIRIDPLTLTIDVNDTTFAVSTGSLVDVGGATITELPVGVAKSCGGGYATANISVSGTPFHLANDFSLGGDPGHVGYAGLWSTQQVIEMWADGDCGWISANQSKISLTFVK